MEEGINGRHRIRPVLLGPTGTWECCASACGGSHGTARAADLAIEGTNVPVTAPSAAAYL